MKKISYFNVIGPVMIGPSSSHTAGAVRIGLASSSIVERGFNKIIFKLHGSFRETYQGHGTDRALVAGCLGFKPDDKRIINAFDIAKEKGIDIEFKGVDLVNAHPNTAILEFYYPNDTYKSITGISVGGGQIEITNIDGADVRILPGDPTLILNYRDRKGVIAGISTILANNDYNILKILNNVNEDKVTLIIVLERKLEKIILDKIKSSGDFDYVSYVYF